MASTKENSSGAPSQQSTIKQEHNDRYQDIYNLPSSSDSLPAQSTEASSSSSLQGRVNDSNRTVHDGQNRNSSSGANLASSHEAGPSTGTSQPGPRDTKASSHEDHQDCVVVANTPELVTKPITAPTTQAITKPVAVSADDKHAKPIAMSTDDKPAKPGLTCNHCAQDYEKEPGLQCHYTWGAGQPCERCTRTGHRNCAKIALVNDRGELRRDRQPIIDLQRMAGEVFKFIRAGSPVPQELQGKIKVLQASVTCLVRIIVDSACKERTLRRALRQERSSLEEEKAKCLEARRMVQYEKTVLQNALAKADVEARRGEAKRQQLEAAGVQLQQAGARIERLLERSKQYTSEIHWHKARLTRLEVLAGPGAEAAAKAAEDQLAASKARVKALEQSNRVAQARVRELEQSNCVAQAQADAQEKERLNVQSQMISSQVELSLLKSELARVTAKHSEDLLKMTNSLTEEGLNIKEERQGQTANPECMPDGVAEGGAKLEVSRPIEIGTLQAEKTELARRVEELDKQLQITMKKHSGQPRLVTLDTTGSTFRFFHGLPGHIKASIFDMLVGTLPSLSAMQIQHASPARVRIPNPQHEAKVPEDVVLRHVLPHISEEDGYLLQGYSNVSLEFRVRCMMAQSKLKTLVTLKIPGGMRIIANAVWNGERRWELPSAQSSTPTADCIVARGTVPKRRGRPPKSNKTLPSLPEPVVASTSSSGLASSSSRAAVPASSPAAVKPDPDAPSTTN